MKGSKIVLLVAALATVAFAPVFGGEAENLARDVQTLRQEVTQLKAMLNERTSDQSVATVLERLGVAQERAGGNVVLSSDTDSLTIGGSLDLRYYYVKGEANGAGADMADDAFANELALNLTWKSAEDWTVAVGLTSGAPWMSTSNFQNFASTAVMGNEWINIDTAYAMHTWDMEGAKLTMCAGQQPMPFVTGPFIWDGDLRPAGITLGATMDPIFVTLGAYQIVDMGPNNDNPKLLAIQAGGSTEVQDGVNVTGAVAYYWMNASANEITWWTDRDMDFQLLDLYLDVSATIEDVQVKVYGQCTWNLGADGAMGAGQVGVAEDPSDEDLAYCIGIEGSMSGVTAGYAYARTEENAQLTGLADDTYSAAVGMDTNVTAHKLYVNYAVSANMTAGVTCYLNDLADDSAGAFEEGQLYIFDVVYNF
jgi:hypothetical protein